VALNTFHERYRRLARDPLGFSSLWLGEDHLVYVKGSGFLMVTGEEYKRFRLSEIEALNLAKTSRIGSGLLFLFVFLASAGIASLMLVLSEGLGPVKVAFISVFVVVALLSLALLVRHLVLGPTCVCDLQTRLTRERIRPLNRYHRALEVVKGIDGLVRERQSGIVAVSAEVADAGVADSRGDGFYSVPVSAMASFGGFIVFGFVALAALHLESLLLTGLVLFLVLAASLLVILALVASVRRPTPDAIRRLLWSLLVLHFLVVGIGSVYYLVAAMREPSYTVGFAGPLEAYTALASEGGMVLYGVFAVLFLGMLGCGIGGIVLSLRWRGRIQRAALLARPAVAPEEPRPSGES
jgi:hypothetical protein